MKTCCSQCGVHFKCLVIQTVHEQTVHGCGEKFKCDCGRRYGTVQKLRQHRCSTNSLAAECRCNICLKYCSVNHVCPNCQKVFSTEWKLKEHMKCHNESSDQICRQCNVTFKSSRNYKLHMNRKHASKVYVCSFEHCDKVYGILADMKRHVRSHNEHKERRAECYCEICDKDFSQPCAARLHKATVHDNIAAYKCLECSESFKWQSALDRHVGKVHNADRVYLCPVCGHIARSLAQHARHSKETHEKKKMTTIPSDAHFLCDACGRKFRYFRGLFEHRGRHHQGTARTHPCRICGRQFARPRLLSDHVRRVHPSTSRRKSRHVVRADVTSRPQSPDVTPHDVIDVTEDDESDVSGDLLLPDAAVDVGEETLDVTLDAALDDADVIEGAEEFINSDVPIDISDLSEFLHTSKTPGKFTDILSNHESQQQQQQQQQQQVDQDPQTSATSCTCHHDANSCKSFLRFVSSKSDSQCQTPHT